MACNSYFIRELADANPKGTMVPDNSYPAFPFVADYGDGGKEFHFGLSTRQWYAAMAMQGLISNPSVVQQFRDEKSIAETSFRVADAMIKEGGR